MAKIGSFARSDRKVGGVLGGVDVIGINGTDCQYELTSEIADPSQR